MACQHGNIHTTCTIVCGVRFCKHTCSEHEPWLPPMVDGAEDGISWAVRRTCLLSPCECAVFLDPATETQAKLCGRTCGRRLAEIFLNIENRGADFHPDRVEAYVREYARSQWALSARHGFESLVEEEAVLGWRDAWCAALFWDDEGVGQEKKEKIFVS